MAWQAICRGANGIFYFSFYDIQRNPDVPFAQQWGILTAIAAEIEHHADVLLSDAGAAPVVAISSSESTFPPGWVTARARWGDDKDFYLFVCNDGNGGGTVKFTLDKSVSIGKSGVTVVSESPPRKLDFTSKFEFSDKVEALDVVVYKFSPRSAAALTTQIDPRDSLSAGATHVLVDLSQARHPGTIKTDDDSRAAALSITDFGGRPIHRSDGKVVRTNNQRAIRKAMVACAAAGGCSLTFPRRDDTGMAPEEWPYGPGPAVVTTYLTSAFNVTSNLKLVVPEGVQLRGTESFADNCGGINRSSCDSWDSPSWPVLRNWVYPSSLQDPGQAPAKQAWLRGYNLTNLTFTGGGIMHGGGGWWWCVRMLAAGQPAGAHSPKWCPREVSGGHIPAFHLAAPPMIMLVGSSNIVVSTTTTPLYLPPC